VARPLMSLAKLRYSATPQVVPRRLGGRKIVFSVPFTRHKSQTEHLDKQDLHKQTRSTTFFVIRTYSHTAQAQHWIWPPRYNPEQHVFTPFPHDSPRYYLSPIDVYFSQVFPSCSVIEKYFVCTFLIYLRALCAAHLFLQRITSISKTSLHILYFVLVQQHRLLD
jgi:hypothetical protein